VRDLHPIAVVIITAVPMVGVVGLLLAYTQGLSVRGAMRSLKSG
jgi:hypothetical protein